MGIKKWVNISLVAILVAVGTLTVVPKVYGQSSADYLTSECSLSNLPYYDARVETASGDYDIFVKMGKRGQVAATSLYIDNGDEVTCQSIGSATANGDTWQKIGSWTSNGNEPVRFQLNSEVFTARPDANRPSIMLVPSANPTCKPVINCDFTFNNRPAFIAPISSMLSEDTLRVMQVRDPNNDVLQNVQYYTDGELLYTKPELMPFDLRYVPGGDHTVSRVMQYESGQKIILQDTVRISFTKDFENLLFRTFNRHRVVIQIVIGLTLAALIFHGTIAILRALHRRRQWKINHGFIHEEIDNPVDIQPMGYTPPPHFLSEESSFTKITKRILPIAMIVVAVLVFIVFIDSYIAQTFRVNGMSMESTLQSNDRIIVSKISKTLSTLNRQEYVPRRGEVVVFRKSHSQLFLDENSDQGEVYVVKRVLGLPGERVTVTNGVVKVFNEDNPDGFDPDKNSSWAKTLTLDPNENIDVILGPSEIFVSGDNRPGSLDSITNGPISVSELIGRARARILPVTKFRNL